ncbi:MAG: DUF4129 domain-containing protein [Woronichinia naegeliana WA131]|jgi:hypothetical protein|uniref:DUF4129 domain-containing protein n=1 Tax=Woronichinia naegeliana WA131 TaxID=2824559 RepID=A0A977KTS0_9CYAN|nr:MAG: DUF4129 domain-containing protein [Woronichinia naegeliana WA131]
MTTPQFEKVNLAWRLQQLQQNLGEWWELQWRRWFGSLPDIKAPRIEDPEFWVRFVANSLIFCLFALLFWSIWRSRRWWLSHLKSWRGLSLPVLSKTESFSVSDWIERSHSYHQKGDYYQACRCLYLAMLQHLHEKGLIPHSPSRTDEEYRLLILELPQPDPYETLLITHQQLCFGQREASASLYARCHQACQEIIPQPKN